MVYLALIVYTIGMLLTLGGRIYVAVQKRRGNTKFQDKEYVKKFIFNLRVIAVCMILFGFVILFFMEK